MRPLVGRYLEPGLYFSGGDKVINEISICHAAAPGWNLHRLGPDISLDKRDALARPTFQEDLRIFEGLVDIAVVEEAGSVRDAIPVIGIRHQAQRRAGHEGAVGEKRTLEIVVECSGMAKLRFLDL